MIDYSKKQIVVSKDKSLYIYTDGDTDHNKDLFSGYVLKSFKEHLEPMQHVKEIKQDFELMCGDLVLNNK